jgi:hypothetical protein
MSEDPNRPPPLWPFALLCAAAAAWIDFGGLHAEQHPDALIQILGSLQAWKPFFWEQDRYGALVPLLAAPVRSPLANLLVQNFITVFAALLTPFLVARYLFRDALYPVVAGVAVAAFLALATPLYRFEFMVDTGYGVPFALGYAALLTLEPDAAGRVSWGQRVLAVVLMVLAHWVFLAAFLTLAPLVALRALTHGGLGASRLIDRTRRPGIEAILSAVAVTAGLAGGWAIRACVDDPWIMPTSFDTLPVERWPLMWGTMAASNWRVHWPYRLWLAALALAALVGILFAIRLRRGVVRDCVAPLGAAAAAFLFMGTRLWVEINGGDYRYSMPSLLLLQMVAFALMLAPARDRLAAPRARLAADALVCVLVFAATIYSYGFPSLAGVRANLDRRLGEHSHDAVAAGCTHIAGDYWFVWKTVYHANLLKAERGLPGEVWGISMRGRPAWPRWRDMPPEEMRIGVEPEHFDDAAYYCREFGLPPLELLEKRPHLWVYRPVPEAK